MTLQSLINQAKLDFVNSEITETIFPEQPIRGEVEVIYLDEIYTIKQGIEEIKKQGYEPANLYELLDYLIKNPEERREIISPILAQHSDGDWVMPVFHRYWRGDRGRGLVLYSVAGGAGPDCGWLVLCKQDTGTLGASVGALDTLENRVKSLEEKMNKLIKIINV